MYGLDGTYLHRHGVLLLHKSVLDNQALWWSWAKSESYESINHDLAKLLPYLSHHCPVGAISDWKGSMVGSIKAHFGSLPHQPCLAHVSRDLRRLLPRHSPLEATQELAKVGKLCIHAKNQEEVRYFKQALGVWLTSYGDHLIDKTFSSTQVTRTGKPKWWYTHKDLRAAYRILINDQESLFIHLAHPIIPTTNNCLEETNTNLKINLANHRGMKPLQQFSFLSWYLILQSATDMTKLKTLWDFWRRQNNL